MSLPNALSHIEARLQEMQTALLSSEPAEFEQAAKTLHATAVQLAQALQQAPDAPKDWPPEIHDRIRAIGQGLNLVRDQLARVLALTQQQAASLLPPSDAGVTYGSGRPGVANGATLARIYRAPG